MSNPCQCCESKGRFIRQINGNFMHRMVIPEWFLKYFGGKIPGTVKLEAADGNIFDVGVTGNMNRVILQSGWVAFVDENQIEENYSLLFRYLGNARFKITIFDSSGKEKILCCSRKETASDVKKPSRHDVDNWSSSHDGTTESSAGKGSHSSHDGTTESSAGKGSDSDGCPKDRHDVDNSSSSHDGTTESSAGEGSDSDGCPTDSSCRYCKSAKMPTLSYTSEEFSEDNPSLDDSVNSDDRQLPSNNYFLSGLCDLTEAQEVKVQTLLEKIRAAIPVLVVVMKKTNVKQNGSLVIRKDYARNFFPSKDSSIILKLPRKNKNWKCKFHIRPCGESDTDRHNFYLGNFVRDNHVREGDICLFQPMTNVKDRPFTVTVHLLGKASTDHFPGGRTGIGSNHGRASKKVASAKGQLHTHGEEYSLEDEGYGVPGDSDGASEPPFMLPGRACLTPAQEKKVLEKVEEIDSELPFYVAIMNKSNVYQRGSHITPIINFGLEYMNRYLREEFAAGHRRGNSRVVSLVLQREGKTGSWPTKLCRRMRRTYLNFRVLKGWPSFARENRLREGDLCLFKLMKNGKPLKMMVYIIRRDFF